MFLSLPRFCFSFGDRLAGDLIWELVIRWGAFIINPLRHLHLLVLVRADISMTPHRLHPDHQTSLSLGILTIFISNLLRINFWRPPCIFLIRLENNVSSFSFSFQNRRGKEIVLSLLNRWCGEGYFFDWVGSVISFFLLVFLNSILFIIFFLLILFAAATSRANQDKAEDSERYHDSQ